MDKAMVKHCIKEMAGKGKGRKETETIHRQRYDGREGRKKKAVLTESW